jgi:hypothetical protein
VLRNVFVVVIGYSQIEQNVQNHREIQERKIQTVTFIAHQILHRQVDSEYPERFD